MTITQSQLRNNHLSHILNIIFVAIACSEKKSIDVQIEHQDRFHRHLVVRNPTVQI